jgi:hypothetical protein
MTPYLRLMLLRIRRRYLTLAFGLPALLPAGITFFALGVSHFRGVDEHTTGGDLMELSCFTALISSVMVTSNMTAFLVYDERTSGRSRLLRLATVDGRPPVVAHLWLAILSAAAGATVGLGVSGLTAVAKGLPVPLWLAITSWSGVVVTVAGPIGAWVGYLLPRTVAMVAVQAVGLGVGSVLGAGAVAAVRSGALSLPAIGWVALAHLVTYLVLPPLWRHTSARLW